MVVYKFRVTFDDPEDISRDIEIKPGQTFEILHQAIQKSINFDGSAPATFYTSDDYWRKGRKISFEELKTTKVVDFIEDPHQKFIYEYDPANKWSFTIELLKIIEGDKTIQYPRSVKSTGIAPAQYHIINPTAVIDEENLSANGEEIDDSVFYSEPENTEIDEDDSKHLEGEEVFEEEEESEEFDEDAFGSAESDEDF